MGLKVVVLPRIVRQRRFLFLHGLAGALPTLETTVEMVDGFEVQLFEDGQGAGAATSGSAVNEVGLGLIQLLHLVGEVFLVKINILGVGNVALLKFLGGADIEDDDIFVFLQKFGGLLGIDVLDVLGFLRRCGCLGLGTEGEETQQQWQTEEKS